MVSVKELLNNPHIDRPHVVVLGAGASVAATPSGDAAGRRLPVMANFCEIVGLSELLRDHGVDPSVNFEATCSKLCASDSSSDLLGEIQSRVVRFFEQLRLPDAPTVYDYLLLSLRSKDVVVTFNWDPFLLQSYRRNSRYPLPQLRFLHGSVNAKFCPNCVGGVIVGEGCPECGGSGEVAPLMYPVEQKDYHANTVIASEWEQTRLSLVNAFTLTVFGYGAPSSDVEAVELLLDAWRARGDRLCERVEVIDIQEQDDHAGLCQRWSPFIYYNHSDYWTDYSQSWIARHPRRSAEALFEPTVKGNFVEPYPAPECLSFDQLYEWLDPIVAKEEARKSDSP